MDPVEEHRLRRWIEKVLAKEGHTLRKTRQDAPQFQALGRYSRWHWDKWLHRHVLMEHHVDLENLYDRCVGYLDRKELGLRS